MLYYLHHEPQIMTRMYVWGTQVNISRCLEARSTIRAASVLEEGAATDTNLFLCRLLIGS